MVAVGYTVGLAVVVYIVQAVYALVHWPVAEQFGLVAGESAVIAVGNLLVGENLCPYAYLVDVAFEAACTELYCSGSAVVVESYIVLACEGLHLLALDKLNILGLGRNCAQCICACAIV